MRNLKLFCIASIVGMSLAGCSSTAGLNTTLDTLAKNYAACDRTVNYSASVGALNPGSGAQVQGTIHCPPHNPDGTTAPTAGPAPVAP